MLTELVVVERVFHYKFQVQGLKFRVMASIEKFEDIEAWKMARELCVNIYNNVLTKNHNNQYALLNQIDRSGGSVMDNIAEGFERDGNKEFIQYLSIAKASCGEVRSQLYRCFDRSLINEDVHNRLSNDCRAISSKIGAFINYLKKSELKGTKYKN